MDLSDIPKDMRHRVTVTACCWWWSGPSVVKYRKTGPQRRAVHNRAGRVTNAARFVVEHLHGKPLLRHQIVLHSCDNPMCVNPKHLRIGSHWENATDARWRGAARPGGVRTGLPRRCCTLLEDGSASILGFDLAMIQSTGVTRPRTEVGGGTFPRWCETCDGGLNLRQGVRCHECGADGIG